MKVTTETPKPEFTPRSITITFESQAELDAIGTLFNIHRLTVSLENVFGVKIPGIASELKEKGANISEKFDTLKLSLRKSLE